MEVGDAHKIAKVWGPKPGRSSPLEEMDGCESADSMKSVKNGGILAGT